jgi:hypothetical protein
MILKAQLDGALRSNADLQQKTELLQSQLEVSQARYAKIEQTLNQRDLSLQQRE